MHFNLTHHNYNIDRTENNYKGFALEMHKYLFNTAASGVIKSCKKFSVGAC